MKNLSAYHQEDFLGNLNLTLMLILVPLLRDLWPFKHRRVFLGHPVGWELKLWIYAYRLGAKAPITSFLYWSLSSQYEKVWWEL